MDLDCQLGPKLLQGLTCTYCQLQNLLLAVCCALCMQHVFHELESIHVLDLANQKAQMNTCLRIVLISPAPGL